MSDQDDRRFPVTEWDFDELRLRTYRDGDAEASVGMCADPVTQRYTPGLPDPYTEADALQYIRDVAPGAWTSGRAQWAIAEAATDRVVGGIGVPRIQPSHNNAEIGYLVAPWARGRDIAARATAQVADYLFKHGMARVELHIMAGNVASQKAAYKAGFGLDGRLRRGMLSPNGGQVDKWVFSRLPSDPPGPVPPPIPELPPEGLTDGVVRLRRLSAADTDAHYGTSMLPEVWQRSVPPVAPTRASIVELCGFGAAERWVHGDAALMSIRDAATDAYAGDFGVHVRMGPPGEVMLSYSLNRDGRGRGFATRAVRLVARWAVSELGARRVMAGTASDNAASQAVLARAGFAREGVQRALLPGLDGTRVDNVCWALLPEDL